MEKFKGTPGPWIKEMVGGNITVKIPKEYGGFVTIKLDHIDPDDDCGVETCFRVLEHSNARLIASAPELLDALQLLLMDLEERGNHMQGDAIKIAQGAINKALNINKPKN